jgi:hypothetical protein
LKSEKRLRIAVVQPFEVAVYAQKVGQGHMLLAVIYLGIYVFDVHYLQHAY